LGLAALECIVERGACLDLGEDEERLPAHHQVDHVNGRLVASGEKPKTLETVGQGTYDFGPTSPGLGVLLGGLHGAGGSFAVLRPMAR